MAWVAQVVVTLWKLWIGNEANDMENEEKNLFSRVGKEKKTFTCRPRFKLKT
jgi:hypothetical protein